MEFIDIGANLTHESFRNDLDEVIKNAEKAGIIHIMLTGTDQQTNLEAVRLAISNPSFFSSTVGFHPHIADKVDESDFTRATDLLLSLIHI